MSVLRNLLLQHEDQFVREGMLLTANDSGYNQGYHAFEMVYDILEQGLNPSRIRTKTPPRGPLMVNRQRANMLGIVLDDKMHIIEEVIETAVALADEQHRFNLELRDAKSGKRLARLVGKGLGKLEAAAAVATAAVVAVLRKSLRLTR